MYLSVAGDGSEEAKLPTPEQADTFAHYVQNERLITCRVIAAIFQQLPFYRSCYGEGKVPQLRAADELKRHIGPFCVHILRTPKDGATCLGFELGCNWDYEHGVGVLTHKGRVLYVNLSDTSICDLFGATPAILKEVLAESEKYRGINSSTS